MLHSPLQPNISNSDRLLFEYIQSLSEGTSTPAQKKNNDETYHAGLSTLIKEYFEADQNPSPQKKRMTAILLTPNQGTPLQTTPQPNTDTSRYGLLHLFLAPANPIPQRSEEESANLRLNMINLYLKYMIQALIYFFLAFLVLKITLWCAQFFTFLLLPIILIGALHMAAVEMHKPNNRMHETNIHQNCSLFDRANLGANVQQCMDATIHFIDNSTNHALRFFSELNLGREYNRMVCTVLDIQIPNIPNNNFN